MGTEHPRRVYTKTTHLTSPRAEVSYHSLERCIIHTTLTQNSSAAAHEEALRWPVGKYNVGILGTLAPDYNTA